MANFTIDLDEGRTDRKVSAFELARYRAGELSDTRRSEIDALLANEPALQAELDELANDEAAFRVTMPFDRFARDHQARLAAAGPFARAAAWLKERAWQTAGGLAAATAAALVLVLAVPQGGAEHPLSPSDLMQTAGVRMKGAARIGFLVQSEGGARWGADGEQLTEGDRIQLVVKDPADRAAMVIVGIDGRGEVSTYAATALVSGTPKGDVPQRSSERSRLLERSLVLDDAVGAERFFVVYGEGELEALRERAVAAAKTLAASGDDLQADARLPLDGGETEQSSVHIVKVPK